jgi:hypothetical protein
MTPQGQDSTGKGHATPKRKDSESKRKNSSLSPIVGREQKKAAKALAKQNRMIQRAAYLRGEDSALPVRDRGPVRRFVRNYVDSRRSTGEYFLPIIFLVLILTYGVLLFAVIDGFFLARRIRKIVSEKFPDAPTKGLGMYAWLRSTQMRRLRAPHPSVKVGESFK